MDETYEQLAERNAVLEAEKAALSEQLEQEKIEAARKMERIMCEQASYIAARSRMDIAGDGRFGIAVGHDECALLWQELEVERQELLGYHKPAAICREMLEENRKKAKESSHD